MKDTMNTRLLPIAVLALCAAACTNDNENLNNDGPVAAKFTADIYESVSTRVNQDGTPASIRTVQTGLTATASASPAPASSTYPT